MNNPHFKYHPNLYSSKNIIHSTGICQCCNKPVDAFINSMYCEADIDCICLNCVANGSAAAKFNGSFVQDAMPLNDAEKKKELFFRTPGYISNQGEYWLTCCEDYCAFLGTADITEPEKPDMANKGITGYIFRCLHCGNYHLWIDAM